MLESLMSVHYCYNYLINQIPVGLLLYSHVPTALTALIFSSYVMLKSWNRSGLLLFIVCFLFVIWSSLDLISWFNPNAGLMMFTWSLLDFFAVLMFFFSYYFLYTFATGKDLPVWQKVVGVVAILPTAYIAFSGLNIPTYDLNSCTALEDKTFTIFTYYAEAFFILMSLVFTVFHYRRNKEKIGKIHILLSSVGVLTLLMFFFSASFLVSLFAATDASSYVYNYLIYGLFGMPLLLAFLGYLVVKYHTFNIKVIGAQALVLTLAILIAATLLVNDPFYSEIIIAITLVLVIGLGYLLTRSVKREVEQREKIEKLAKELGEANEKLQELDQMKSEFLSLATHQIRAPLTAIKGYSSMLLEGEFGVLPPKARDSAETIMKACQNLINIVNDFLNISRIEQGRMVYEKSVFELGELAKEVANELKPNVENAGLMLGLEIPENLSTKVNADRDKIRQVIGNVVDNAIKYTPRGGMINVSVFTDGTKAKVAIKDSGIGIDPKEMGKLFNKFSRTKDANKTSVTGTGLGLYVAKKMVEAHRGDIKVFSAGLSYGSTFVVELPKYEQ
ncbi:MAG: Multi-sensor hybrid histidine kinase [Candidatus Woesebacteria bacterium GW2011_GWA1_39_8]|uniref:histidine kinase n=1 Tax=Candidatus Woesebacteria bacterium GW2011_GWA1_39_8 TaxID=1618552 RepID=A0A0G0PT10_9BACT|nr:MAG: Multi-sensor hybrid histidine kinase [Candidatus Woesebacteria bacterium GW2011_GWA1_39_8]